MASLALNTLEWSSISNELPRRAHLHNGILANLSKMCENGNFCGTSSFSL